MVSESRGFQRWVALVGVGLACGAGLSIRAEDAPKKVHPRPELIRPALREAATALMRDDIQAALSAVEQLQQANPRLFIEDNELFGESAKSLSQSLHKVLEGTKVYLNRGNVEEAFNEFVWVQRTCRACHQKVRQQGLLPAEGALWEPDPKRVESTQTPSPSP